MTIRRRYAANKALLTCDTCFDPERNEEYPLRTEVKDIAAHAKRHGWRIEHMFGDHFRHTCPACEQIRRTSASYQERIHA